MNADRLKLTEKQRSVLRVIDVEGGPCSFSYLWQEATTGTGRGLSRIVNNLERRGLVARGGWWNEDDGYEYDLTELGREAIHAA